MESSTVQTTHKLTILHLVISLETGGLERFVIDLIEANQKEFNQFVVCLERTGELFNTCNAEVISLNMPPGPHLRAAWNIAKIVRHKQVDIIHTHNEKAQLYGGIAGLLAKVPVVHTKHGKNNINWRTTLRNNISARLCRKVVAVSRDAAIQCIKNEKIPSNKVLTVFNGVDVDHFFPSADRAIHKKMIGVSPDTLVIGIVARLAPVKDHCTLLKACGFLKQGGYKFKLVIVGDGLLRRDIELQVFNLGLDDCVIFTGTRSNIPELMNAMDVFVLSSISEGISLTLIEAMSCEIPVVATAVGGNPEVVLDGVTGFLVPPKDPRTLAMRISLLLCNPNLRNEFGKKARQRALNEFSLATAIEKYSKLYFAVMCTNLPQHYT